MPLFQNEPSCKTFHSKKSLIRMKMNLHYRRKTLSWFRKTETSFEKAIRKWPIALGQRERRKANHILKVAAQQ